MTKISDIPNDQVVDRFDRLLGSSSEGGTRNYKIQDILSLIGISDVDNLQDTLTQKADLVNGLVPASQLPSFVDDVIEVANYASLPVTGELGKIYITLDNNKTYRWSGSTYIEIKDDHAVWGSISGILSNQTDLQNALNAKGNLTGGNTWNGVQTFDSIDIEDLSSNAPEIRFLTGPNLGRIVYEGTTSDLFKIYISSSNQFFSLSTDSFVYNNQSSIRGIIDYSAINTSDKTFTLPNASGTIALADVDNNFTASQTIRGLSGQGGGIGLSLENTTASTGKTYEVLSYDNGEFAVRSTLGGVGQILRYNETTGWNFTTAGTTGNEDATFGGNITTTGSQSKISGYQFYADERFQVGDAGDNTISILQREFLTFSGTGTKIIAANQGDLLFNSNSFTFNNNVTVNGNLEVGTDTSDVATILRRQNTGDYVQLYRSGINVANISASSQGLRLWGLNSVVINPASLDVDFFVYSDVNTAILVDGATGNTTFGNDILVTTAHRLYDNGNYLAVGDAPVQTYDTTGGNSGLRDYININTASNHIFRRFVDVGGADTLLQEFFGDGKIQLRGTAQSSVPTGTSRSGFLNIGNQTAGTFDYGMSFGVLTSGKGFIQQKRFSGTATEYALQINPLGGFVEFYDNVEFYGSGWNSGDNFYFRTSGVVGSETLSINFNDASVASTKLIEFTEDLVETNVQVRLSNLPTSSTGLSAGDLWNDGGTVKIV